MRCPFCRTTLIMEVKGTFRVKTIYYCSGCKIKLTPEEILMERSR